MANGVTVRAKGTAITSSGSGDVTIGGASSWVASDSEAVRICIALDTATTLLIRHNSVNLKMNAGASLVADALYTFSIELPGGESFTIRTGASCTIRTVTISGVAGDVI